jgi:glycosyltransferase involved in cell wall biosynthesis
VKIALLVHDYHRSGGHSRYVAELATRFAREHEVHVFANTFTEEPGITFHHVPASRANALALIWTFRRNASRMLGDMQGHTQRDTHFDVIHDQGLCSVVHNVLTAHISNRAWARARPGAPLKEKVFSLVIGRWEQWQYGRAGRVQVIAVASRVARDLAADYDFRGPVTVIHHGVDTGKFTPDDRSPGLRNDLRNELGVPAGEPLFLFVGDFRKGVEAAIRALGEGHLLSVGSTPPDAYQALAAQLGRGARVHFRPATDTIEQYYNGADVLVLPTPYDAFGMVVLEAMAAGLPVVVSQNAGASELIDDGRNGYVLRNEASLPELMHKAATGGPELGLAARTTALEHTWDRVAAETLAVYQKAQQTPRILAFATQGAGGNDEARLCTLVQDFAFAQFAFDAQRKLAAAGSLFRKLWRDHYPLVIMEGTGIAGGLPLLASRLLFGQRYVVSSGDAIQPFVSQKQPWLGPVFGLYEHLLYKWAAGFIGWSPYLVGRALTYGVPRAMTAAGWAPSSFRSGNGAQVRQQLGIPADALVIGIAGSLTWTAGVRYCYGYELVRAALSTKRTDIRFLIVGDGSGRSELERFPDPRVILTGFIPREQLPDYFAAMDLASLPQSCDGVGSFRYTTKLSEYLAAGLPVVTGQIPAAYDLDRGWAWRLPGNAPWDVRYVEALGRLLDGLTREEIEKRRSAVPAAMPEFDAQAQIERVTAFLNDILAS